MQKVIRHRELARLSSLLTCHRAAAVVGRTGLGKNSLLKALEANWEGGVIRVPCSSSESTTPYSGIDILLTAVGALKDTASGSSAEAVSTTPAMSREEARVAVDSPTLFDPVADHREGRSSMAAVADAAIDVLCSTQMLENTLIVIADADEMDAQSQSVLGQIIRRLPSGRFRIVVSARSITAESPLDPIACVELRDLSHDELIELVHRLTNGRIADESAHIVASAASGRPLAVRHILDAMNRSERLGEIALTIPVRTGRAGDSMMRDIIGNPSTETLDLLRLLSLAPSTPYRPLLARVPNFWEIVDGLETRDIVERRGANLRITSGLVRAWAHQSMSSSERIAGHQQLADDCSESDSRLEHWHASFSRTTEQSAPTLIDDSRSFIRRGASEAGIEFAERAIRVNAEDEALATGLLDVAQMLYERGEFVFASRYVRISARSSRRSLAVRARILDIRITFAQRQTLPSHLLNSWTRAELTDVPADVARLQLILSIYRSERGEYAEADELLRAAQGASDHLGEPERQLLEAAMIRVESSRGRDLTALRSFTAMGARDAEVLEPDYVLSVASGLMLTEHYESAQAALALLRDNSERGTIWHTQALCLQTEAAIRAGHLRQASELIDSIGSGMDDGAQVRPDRFLTLRCWQLLMAGRASDAEPVEAQLAVLATATDNRRLLAELNALQGSALLRMGYPAEAVRHLQRCDELSTAEVSPNARRHETDLIEALVEIGRREHAGLLVARLRKRVEKCHSRWAELALSRCEALLASGEKSSELFNIALRSWRPQDSLFEKALTHAAFARRLNDLGSGPRAREQLLTAASIFAEVGAERLAEGDGSRASLSSAADALPELPQLSELSEEELKVVELVRAGLKNKEIAGRVFVSLRTVELRLTAVYRKLDVGSRTELVSRLAGNPRLAAV